jgi:centromere/kinetochore protein ZW10
LRTSQTGPQAENQDDDAADAWGWGDEDGVDEAPIPSADAQPSSEVTAPTTTRDSGVREVTLVEQYAISSMPAPVLETISSILDDAAALTQEMWVYSLSLFSRH